MRKRKGHFGNITARFKKTVTWTQKTLVLVRPLEQSNHLTAEESNHVPRPLRVPHQPHHGRPLPRRKIRFQGRGRVRVEAGLVVLRGLLHEADAAGIPLQEAGKRLRVDVVLIAASPVLQPLLVPFLWKFRR